MWYSLKLQIILSALSICLAIPCLAQQEKHTSSDQARQVACSNWDKVPRLLPELGSSRTLCSRLENCTGISCTGQFKRSPFSLNLRLVPCSPLHALEISINYTAGGILNFNKTFHDGDELRIEDLRLPVVANVTVPAYLAVDLKPLTNDSLSMSIAMKGCNTDKVNVLPSCPIIRTLLKHQTLSIPSCPTVSLPKTLDGIVSKKKLQRTLRTSNCDVFHAFDSPCGANEECLQISVGNGEGHCECFADFSRDASGVCQPNSESDIPTSTTYIPVTTSTPTAVPSIKAGTLVNIIAPLFAVAVFGALIVAAIKLQWFQKITSRLHSRLEEDIVIGSPGLPSSPSSNDDDLIV